MLNNSVRTHVGASPRRKVTGGKYAEIHRRPYVKPEYAKTEAARRGRAVRKAPIDRVAPTISSDR
jgi:hypothetical protein